MRPYVYKVYLNIQIQDQFIDPEEPSNLRSPKTIKSKNLGICSRFFFCLSNASVGSQYGANMQKDGENECVRYIVLHMQLPSLIWQARDGCL